MSPCKTAAVGSAKETLNEICETVQAEFHPTWVPIIYGVEFKGKKAKFLTGRTNWNNSYDLESCIQMTHNYSGSKIPLNEDNPHMPSGRRDLVGMMFPMESPPEGNTRNCTVVRDLSNGLSGMEPKLVPIIPTESNEMWGQQRIDEVKEYLKLDLAKNENRIKVAEYCGFKGDWELKSIDLIKNAEKYGSIVAGGRVSVCVELREFYAMLRKKSDKFKWFISSIEGKHGAVGWSSLLLGRSFHHITGEADESTELTYETLVEQGLINPSTIEAMNTTYQQEIHDMICGNIEQVDALKTFSSIRLYYLKKPFSGDDNWSSDDAMDASRTVSMAISDSKVGSTRSTGPDIVAEFIRNMINDLNKGKVKYRPLFKEGDTVEQWPACPTHRGLKSMGVEDGKLPPKSEMHKVYKLPTWRGAPEQRNFLDNPAAHTNDEGFKRFWARPAVEKSKLWLMPPFVNTINSLIVDPGKGTVDSITTSKINQMYFSVKILLWLYAGLKKITIDEAVKDKRRIELTEVMVYFYTTSAYNQEHNTLPFGVPQWYPDSFVGSKHFDTADKSIMMSARFLATLIDAALTHPGELTGDHSVNAREKYSIDPKDAGWRMRKRLEALSNGVTLMGKQCRDMDDFIQNTSK